MDTPLEAESLLHRAFKDPLGGLTLDPLAPKMKWPSESRVFTLIICQQNKSHSRVAKANCFHHKQRGKAEPNQTWDTVTEWTKSAAKQKQCQAQAATAGILQSTVVKSLKFPETSVISYCQGLRVLRQNTKHCSSESKSPKGLLPHWGIRLARVILDTKIMKKTLLFSSHLTA